MKLLLIMVIGISTAFSCTSAQKITEQTQRTSQEIVTSLPLKAKPFDYHGFQGMNFPLVEVGAKLVLPKKLHPEQRWIIRARFWGHEPQFDLAMLEKGYAIAHIKVSHLFGSPSAVKRIDALYQFMQERGFHNKVILEGMSRGGLICYNWAKVNPNKVAAIYADAPVCDIRSWPGNKGSAKPNPALEALWEKCLSAYQISDKESETFLGSPIHGLEKLTEAGVPLLHVCGDADDVVPMSENTRILANNYRSLGGFIKVISKAGVGHHPHSLEDPSPIVDFMEEYALY